MQNQNKNNLEYNQKTTLIAINKPRGIICTHKDEFNRRKVFDLIPKKSLHLIDGKLHSIGRLDYNSQGLLLLTNNTKIKYYLESPKNKISRIYKVRVQGNINRDIINKIKKGVKINNFIYKVTSIKLIKGSKSYNWLLVKLDEGKNQHIRKIFFKFGLSVNKLIRIQYGPYKLSSLEIGAIKFLKPFKIKLNI